MFLVHVLLVRFRDQESIHERAGHEGKSKGNNLHKDFIYKISSVTDMKKSSLCAQSGTVSEVGLGVNKNTKHKILLSISVLLILTMTSGTKIKKKKNNAKPHNLI